MRESGTSRTAGPAVPVWGTGFAMVPGWLMRKQPSGNAILVYVHLAMHGTFNPGSATYEECRPSKKTLAAGDRKRGYPGTGLSESSVARALRELLDLRAIIGEQKWNQVTRAQEPTVYRLVFGSVEEEMAAQHPMSPVTRPPHVADDTGAHVTDDTEGMSPVTYNQEPLTHNPGTQKKDQNLPPTPRPKRHAAREAKVESGGDSFPTSDSGQPDWISDLTAELVGASGWSPETTQGVIDHLEKVKKIPAAEITAVLRDIVAGKYDEKHGRTGSPNRLLKWWPVTAPAATVAEEPTWAKGPVTYLAPGTRMCREHRGEPAGNCGKCKADRVAVDRDEHSVGEEWEKGEALRRARQIAANAGTGRAPSKPWRPTPPPPAEGPDPERAGAVLRREVAGQR